MTKALTVILFCVFATACVYVPRQAEEQPYAERCDIASRSYALDVEVIGDMGCHNEGCLIALGIVPAGSLIVSGSIVLINNTYHWLEYQSRC